MKNVIATALLAALVATPGAVAAGKTQELTRNEAQAAALKAVPGDVLGYDKELEGKTSEWEFDIKTKDGSVREVEVDAKTGKVEPGTTIEIEEQGNGVNRKTANTKDLDAWKAAAKVSKEDAEKAALARVPGKVTDWESELENGKPQYEFLIESAKGKKVVEVNAKTGKVSEENTFLEGDAI